MNYNIDRKVAIVTGAGGAICGEIAKAMAHEGVSVAIWDISLRGAMKIVDIISEEGYKAIAIQCNVLDKVSVRKALKKTLEKFKTVDILINGAGGGKKEATTSNDLNFFNIDPKAINDVVSLNYMGSVICSQAVGRIFAEKKSGVILNISSIGGISPLTRSIAYCSGKAATNNFTQWLAVYMSQNFSPKIRVNAIAPGFMLTEQNKFLLFNEKKNELTKRGKRIINFVPMARLGNPKEIIGAALWLVSDAASFVTGAIVPVDGGFTAFSGV